MNLVWTVPLAKRDLLENRDCMDFLVRRVIQGLQDRKARQERRGDLACQADPARVAPWALLGHQVLQEREATLDPRGPQGTLDCLVFPALWETW